MRSTSLVRYGGTLNVQTDCVEWVNIIESNQNLELNVELRSFIHPKVH